MGSFIAIHVLLFLMGLLSTNQLIGPSFVWEGQRHKEWFACYQHTILVQGGRRHGEEDRQGQRQRCFKTKRKELKIEKHWLLCILLNILRGTQSEMELVAYGILEVTLGL